MRFIWESLLTFETHVLRQSKEAFQRNSKLSWYKLGLWNLSCRRSSSWKGNWDFAAWAVWWHPLAPAQLVGKVVGIWPKGNQSPDRPVTYDMAEIEKTSRANWILTLGNLIQETPRAEPVRKGAETARVPGGRVEATKSQNHMQAKVMRKQKLWVTGSWLAASREASRCQERVSTWLWDDGVVRATLALKTYNGPSMCTLPTPTPLLQLASMNLDVTIQRTKLKQPKRLCSTFQLPTY